MNIGDISRAKKDKAKRTVDRKDRIEERERERARERKGGERDEKEG